MLKISSKLSTCSTYLTWSPLFSWNLPVLQVVWGAINSSHLKEVSFSDTIMFYLYPTYLPHLLFILQPVDSWPVIKWNNGVLHKCRCTCTSLLLILPQPRENMLHKKIMHMHQQKFSNSSCTLPWHKCTHTFSPTCTQICKRACLHIYMHAYIRTCTHTYIQKCIHT